MIEDTENEITPDPEDGPVDNTPAPVASEEPQAEPEQPEAEPEQDDDENAKRLARLGHEAREAKKLARQLKAELDQLKGARPPEAPDAELERKIEERAARKNQEAAWTALCNDVYSKGGQEYGRAEFDADIKTLSDQTGTIIPPVIVEAAYDAGDAHKILHYLAENPDTYDDLLNMPIHRMGAKVAQIASKLSTPKPKQISKAPPPIKPVKGESRPDVDLDSMPIDEYMAWMDKHEMKRRHG